MVETIVFSKTKRVIPREEARREYQEGKKQANLPKPKPQGITKKNFHTPWDKLCTRISVK